MTDLTAAETIAEITNLKILEVYRKADMLSEAKETDDHLTDLSTRIIEALELLPARRAPKNLLLKLETTFGEDLDKQNTPQERPPTEQDPALDAAGADELSQTPISSGELDTKESNETPATDQAQDSNESAPGAPREDEPGSVGGGADLEPKHSRDPVADEIEAYMEDNDLTVWQAAKQLGVSGETLLNATNGARRPRKGTVKKIRKMIAKTKPKKKPTASVNTPPPPSKPSTLKPNGKGSGQFVRMKLATWMGRERLGVKDAAVRLGINEASIRSINADVLPDCIVLKIIARHIPEIQTSLGFLLGQAKAQNSGQGAAT